VTALKKPKTLGYFKSQGFLQSWFETFKCKNTKQRQTAGQ